MTDLLLGLDIGTSSLKALLVDSRGRVEARVTERYDTRHPAHGHAEQDPDEWLSALDRVFDSLPSEVRDRIAGIGVDGHVPSLVAVDADGRPVLPCLTWQDARATAEASHLADRLGDAEQLFGTRIPWAASQLPAKTAWLAAHAPETAARTAHLLQPKDFVNLHLTDVVATDAWSSKGLCHVTALTPAVELFSEIGLSPALLPPLRAPWTRLGGLSLRAARRWGLPAGIPVAVGWSDAMASVLATGGFDRPSAVVLTGTSEIVGMSAPAAHETSGVYLVPRAVAPLALSYGPTQSSGSSLLWIARNLGIDVGKALDLAAEAGEPPTFAPYLDGERAPLWDADVRGLFLGLHHSHGPGELVRAVLDGVACSAAHVLTTAGSGTGLTPTVVNVGGRGIDHPAWLAARASALALPLRLHTESHLTALGAAMLAALAAGAVLTDLDAMRGKTGHREPTSSEIERGVGLRDRYLAASRVAQDWSTR
ncbi:xylulokinase [Microbacterium sp. 179-I 3D3 NHS]|uniref:xylulokinase n=1 Tax=unclassified Microbacterium TaxID=2609290 RepID=UPI0039A3B216